MGSKKNLISIATLISLSAMMLLVLFLFQVSASGVDLFIKDKNLQIDGEKRLTQKDALPEEEKHLLRQKKKTYIWAEEDGTIPAAVTEGLTVIKEPYEPASPKEVLDKGKQAERFILCRAQFRAEEVEQLQTLVRQGIDLIFTELPENWEQSPILKKLTGIDEALDNAIDTDGLRVLEDYMLGGRSDYKKLPVRKIPWLRLKGSTKTYMCGLFKNYEKNDIKNEQLPPLAWRNRYSSAYIFVFNGGFLEEKSNLGMFVSALAVMEDSFLYPVINARTLLVNNFPYLTSENAEEMQNLYSMSARRFLEDTILPDLVAITEKTGDVISAAANVSFDQRQETGEEGKRDTLQSFEKTLLKQNGDLGIGFFDLKGSAGKISSNLSFFQKNTQLKFPFFDGAGLNEAKILEVKQKLPETGTVIRNWGEEEKELLRFMEEDLVSVPVTSSGYVYSDAENLKLKNAITAMGLSNHKIDIEEVVYPKKKKDNWRYQSVELGKNLDTYWLPYRLFDTVPLSEEGQRVRQYLLMDYACQMEDSGNEMEIEIENFHTRAYFLLRTNRELLDMEGGGWEEAGGGAYLLTLTQEQARVRFKNLDAGLRQEETQTIN